MNLVNGKLISIEESIIVTDQLNQLIIETLNEERFTLDDVINACDTLAKTINIDNYKDLLGNLGISNELADEYIKEAKVMLSKEYLWHKVKTELGESLLNAKKYIPPFALKGVTEQRVPLGVLFHIAAGNIEGLPVFTVIEGLLAGNINIIKLPSEEGGLSVMILQELIKIEPKLTKYIYVFEFSSKDTVLLKKLADLSNAIVVWGGDNVVKAVRAMAEPSTKIIEWGHKVSFAYVSLKNLNEDKLITLAKSICKSNQVLCSSCQGIYIDTDNDDDLESFASIFKSILDNESSKTYNTLSFSLQSLIGLSIYNEELNNENHHSKVIKGKYSNLIIYQDSRLTTSMMYRNVWIKKLPKNKIIEILKPYKNYLQTVFLITDNQNEYINLLVKAGLEKIVDNSDMSQNYCGENHDGVYPLLCYTKIIVIK